MATGAIALHYQHSTSTSHEQQAASQLQRTLPYELDNLAIPSLSSRPRDDSYSHIAASDPIMSFAMSQSSQSAMMRQQPTSFRQYIDHDTPQSAPAEPMQIYTAVYSGVDVYEMEVKGIAVMRRRADSWLNATQILKVAGVEKGKRTKVLEKEILIGEHEKVQGGYGKYQGTWIKFERGVDFCRQYNVEEILRPLLTYDMGQNGSQAGQGTMETPTKEQAMAAQRKRLYKIDDARTSGQSGTFFKNISTTASNAVAAISKARFDSPGPRHRQTNARPTAFSRQNSQQTMDENMFPLSQQSMHSYTSENSYMANTQDSAYAAQTAPMYTAEMVQNGDFHEPPRKRMRPSSQSTSQQPDIFYDSSMREPSPTIPNDSFVYHQHSQNMTAAEEAPKPLPPLPMADTEAAEARRATLMSLFIDLARTDFEEHDAFTTLAPECLDMPIDNTAHTALHWAGTLARISLLKKLIASGASIYRVNGGGETALMRACLVTNNLDSSTFPNLLELLGSTMEIRDGRGRTVLHHIALTSAVKGRSAASKYYLETLLEFVVRSGSVPNSQQDSFPSNTFSKRMSIGRFMSEIVNAQDKSGDTALNIAARIGNRSIISQLLEVGADAGIANGAGLRPIDFGIGDPAEAGNGQIASPDKSFRRNAKESSGDIISSITALLTETEKEFTTEMEAKQIAIDGIHAQLRDASAQLGEQRRNLELQEARARARTECQFQIANLRQAEAEEKHRSAQVLQQRGLTMNGDQGLTLGHADASIALLPPGMSATAIVQDPRLAQSLPPAQILTLHVSAYVENNNALEASVRALKSRSVELEEKYRRLIILCANVTENKLDEALPGLFKAVDSEPGLDINRVRDFLQKVDEVSSEQD